MTRSLLVGLVVGLFVLPSSGQGDGKTIQANWLLLSMEDNGQAQPVPKEGTVAITKDKFTMMDAGKPVVEYGFKIDTTKTPMWIDLEQGKSKVLGICELKDDKLTICLGHPDKARAKSFITKGVPENDVKMVLQRAK